MNRDKDPDRGSASFKKWKAGPPPMDPQKLYINAADEDQMEIQGYIQSRLRQALIYLCILVTAGLLRLVFHWLPHWYLRATHRQCSLAEATAVLMRDQYKQWFVAKVQTITRDGTRVAVLKPSASFSFTAKSKRRQAQLFLNTAQSDENLIRYFVVKKVKYIWNAEEDKYMKLRGLEAGNTCSYFHEAKGLTYEHQRKRRVLYGSNIIDVHVVPVMMILFKEALTPFYVFQIFSTCVWYADEYHYYATCILFISAISLSATIYQTRKMQRALRNTIQTSTIVTVCRGGDVYEDLPSEDLVPGDVIEIPHHGCTMQCDAVLVSGNCIVNESMLTGESVPVTKTPLPDTRQSASRSEATFNMKDHARHTLFCGTQVIQTRYYGNQKVRAVVLRTGFLTSKGELVRSILYPKPVDFKFNRDTYIFVGVLAFIACIGLVYTVVLKVERGDTVDLIIKRSLDLITIAVPPALPAALTVGIVFAQSRMKDAGIFCISPRSINICGSINAVCFDKTGTLTEDGLNLQGVVPVTDGEFTDEITNMILLEKGPIMQCMASCHSLTLIDGNLSGDPLDLIDPNVPKLFTDEITNMILLEKGPIMQCMASCHSLTLIDGNLSGDPLDLIMFQSVNWVLEEAGEENSRFDMLVPTIVYPRSSQEHTMNAEQLSKIDQPGEEIGIMRQFTFSSSLQRMSVIIRRIAGTQFEVFSKGSPEMITSLCDPATVPSNFHEVLKTYTQHGYRVLGLAWRQLTAKYNYVKVQRVQRDTVEKDMTFLGLIVMENKLKIETMPVIEQLNEANIRTIMVTGDNILTALSVAQECRMVARGSKIVLVEAQPGTAGMGLPQVQFLCEQGTGKSWDKDTSITEIQMEDATAKYVFATTGRSWEVLRQHFPEILAKVLVRGVVFARMSPEQKAQLVEALQDLGYYVAMCGDGANDCGALKTAHAGISLSEAEASVASPFTSKKANIECVPTVIREGRAALVTSFGIFKYMACYSLTQFVSVLILYKVYSNLTDFEFLYIDLYLLTSLSVTFGRTAAYPQLAKDPPQLSLTSFGPIMSLVLQMCIQIAAQVFCYFNIQQQPWFTPHEPEEEDDNVSYENMAVFLMSMYQYLILAVAFSKGSPYRKSIFTNYWFLLNIVVCLLTSVWITVYPVDFLVDLLELKPIPSIPYRLVYLGIAVFNCLLSITLETFLLDHAVNRDKMQQWRERCCPSLKFEYHVIEDEIVATPTWPPLGPGATPLLYRQHDDEIHDDFAKETDRMLADSGSINTCNNSTSSLGCNGGSSSRHRYPSGVSVASSHQSMENTAVNVNVGGITALGDISEKKSDFSTPFAEQIIDETGDNKENVKSVNLLAEQEPKEGIVPESFGYTLQDKSPL